MKEKSNNLRFENDEPPVSPSSVKVYYIHYYAQDEKLRNNLKSVVKSDMNIDEKIDLILALCQSQYTTVQTPDIQTPDIQPKIWYKEMSNCYPVYSQEQADLWTGLSNKQSNS